jgi:hypothetical protein
MKTIENIDCYNEWEPDGAALMVGTWANGAEMEEIWGPPEAYNTWKEVVAHLSQWADRHGHEINELTAC